MHTLVRRMRPLIMPLIIALVTVAVALPPRAAVAGIVGTETVLAEQAIGERAQLLALIDRGDVQEQLMAHGVSPAEAAQRVASLTDTEVLELAERMDSLPAGASTATLLLLVIIIILLVR